MTKNNGPNFFIVGAPKCGTTAWVEYLSRHPDVFFNELKETYFFATDFENRLTKTHDAFLKLYSDAGEAAVLGDASTWHLRSEVAARNIKTAYPEAKVLILLREVGTFIPSWHNQAILTADETDDDLASVWAQSGPDRQTPRTCRDPKLIDYKMMGAFADQVERYFEAFGPDQLRVAWMEDWRANPHDFYRFLLDFLDLRPFPIEDFSPVNAARRHRSRLLAGVLRSQRFMAPAARILRRIGIGPLGIHTRLKRANASAGYRVPVPDDLVREIRAHYRDDTERLHALLDGSGIVYKPPLTR